MKSRATSNRDFPPHESGIDIDRLRSRFAWGLMADIEPPELEVRVAILRKKAAAEQIHLPDDVALYIATAVKSNVRELEGALIRLAAYASLSVCPSCLVVQDCIYPIRIRRRYRNAEPANIFARRQTVG